MTSMIYNGDEYYEKITSIQQSMYEREKRRLELERELFAYSRSDKRISQIKCSKLHSHLKEISDREEKAQIRNLELLRDVESLEISIKNYQPDCGPLQQQMAIVSNKISKMMEARTRKGHEAKAAKLQVNAMQHQDISFTPPVNVPPVLSIMGQHTEVGPTSACSDHTLNHSLNDNMHSHEHLPSGHLKDSKTGIKDAASSQTYLSDDISSSNDPPDGYNLSDKHKITSPEHPTVCGLTDTARNVPFRSDSVQEPLPPVTLTQAEEKISPSMSGLMGAKKTIVEKTKPKDLASLPQVIEEAGKGLKLPESTTEKKSFVSPGSCVSTLPSSEANFSGSNSSALSISVTQSELDEDLESDAADKSVIAETDNNQQNSPEGSFHSEKSDSSSQGVTMSSLSQKGLFRLLDTIEGHLHGEQTSVYSNPSIDTKELNRIISLCNTREDLNGEDPKACGAVVLHELQRLSWSTAKGCLLSQDLVSAHQSCTEPNQVSGSLPPDAAQLWDRWFKHALLLKERHVLSTEHLVQLFTPLLLECHATYSHQAKVLLRTLLSRSSEECPSAEDQSVLSSFGPSPLPDCTVMKPQLKQHIQELQSSEEDSQDESPVESVPIRESKAYQLLKQTAMQKRRMSSKEDDEEDEGGLLGINDDHDENLGRAKRSLHQNAYPRMEKVNSKAHAALQSKAFWGESDDSNSEIEAALRPQPFTTNNVDTDDFYD